MRKVKAVFLDRDGTIGGSSSVELPGIFELYDGAKEAIRILKDKNVQIYSFTNQPDISRGKVRKEDFEKELIAFGFDKVYLCPHTHEEGCPCRKPNTQMLEIAKKDNDISLHDTVVIGDRWSDMLAAARVGAVMILVKTGAGIEALTRYRHKWSDYTPDYIANDILDGVEWMVDNGMI